MRGKVTMIAATAMLTAQPMSSLTAQSTQDVPIQTLPGQVDRPGTRPPGTQRPVPLPEPIPGRPPTGQPNRPDGFAGRLTCESRNNRVQRCNARTENRVELLSSSSVCTRGRSWGYDQRQIWVSHNCRGTFGYGRGNNHWNDRPGSGNNNNNGGGLSTGAIIGGVAVAAGLVTLLNNRNRSSTSSAPPPPQPTTPVPPAPTPPPAEPQPQPQPQPPAGPFPPGPPAVVVADLASLPPDARPSMNTCLMEAARQVGVTGGTQVRFDRLVHIEPGNGGWRFRAQLIATYPDAERMLPLFCRATPTRVVELDFRN
ncbi:DUF3011 domain-containing protein [Novosphingobium sp. BL-8A]|uniref:DUF3011 domain-containing protein n=1 Tax=Novosphingobium sp. BL-8A TaxID=3127639 RepID=UPI0037570598